MTDTHQTTILESLAKTRDTAIAAHKYAVDNNASQCEINDLKIAMLDAKQAYADAVSKILDENRPDTQSIKKQLDEATGEAKSSLKSLESITDIIKKIKIAVELAIQLAGILL